MTDKKDPIKEIQDLYKKVNSQLTGDEDHQWGLDLTNLAATKNKSHVADAHEYIHKSKTVDSLLKKSSKIFRDSLADKVTEFFNNIEDDLKNKYNLSEIKDEKKLMTHASDFLEVLVLHSMEQNYRSLGWEEKDIKERLDKIKKKDPQSRHEIIQNIFGEGDWQQLVRQYMNLLKQEDIDFTDIAELYKNERLWNMIYGSFEKYTNPIKHHINNINTYVKNAYQWGDEDTIDAFTKKYEKMLPDEAKIKRDEKGNPKIEYNEMINTLIEFYKSKSNEAFKPVQDSLEGDLGIKYEDPSGKK